MLNQGNSYNHIEGSLNVIDYTNFTSRIDQVRTQFQNVSPELKYMLNGEIQTVTCDGYLNFVKNKIVAIPYNMFVKAILFPGYFRLWYSATSSRKR